MKDLIKGFWLLVIGLLTAIILYPFLHELGHVVMACFVGAEIIKMRLLPIPYVLCNMMTCSTKEMGLVGIGGILLPFILTEIRTPKRFWMWYVWLLVRGISLLAITISIISIFCFQMGEPVANEDVTQLLMLVPEWVAACLWLMMLLMVLAIRKIVKSKPVERCLIEFHMK